MKNRIIINSGRNVLNFYLVNKAGTYYLFTQKYTPGVYAYFENGRAENELRSFRDWNKNPRLDKTIEKIPMYVNYVMREYVLAEPERTDRIIPARVYADDEREVA